MTDRAPAETTPFGAYAPQDLKFDERGLIPAIVQVADSGEVVMLGYMNEEALRETLRRGQAVFWSRSRQELWHKGATSGDYFDVVEVTTDCDQDAVLLKVNLHGAVCHTGARSDFLEPDDTTVRRVQLAR